MYVKLTRYEDGSDRCPQCGAIKAVRGLEHRPWCDWRNSAIASAEQPPTPGPIWTNGLAEHDDPEATPDWRDPYASSQPGPNEQALRRARRLLEYFRREVHQQWAWAALNYITAEYRAQGLDETSVAMLHLIAEEMHG